VKPAGNYPKPALSLANSPPKREYASIKKTGSIVKLIARGLPQSQ
jgi:hypothetical protein